MAPGQPHRDEPGTPGQPIPEPEHPMGPILYPRCIPYPCCIPCQARWQHPPARSELRRRLPWQGNALAVGFGMCLDPAVIPRVCSPNNMQEAGVSPPGPPSRAPSLPAGDPQPDPGPYGSIHRDAEATTVVWCCGGAGWDQRPWGRARMEPWCQSRGGSPILGPPWLKPSSLLGAMGAHGAGCRSFEGGSMGSWEW